jgi:thioesterase domain-containing protein
LADEGAGFEALVKACQARSLIPPELSTDEVRRYLNRARNNVLAAWKYAAAPISAPLYLFAAEEAEAGSALRNWELVLPARQIRLIPVPGTHLSIMEPPNVAYLGAALSQAMHGAL